MITTRIDGIESLKIERASGNLLLRRGDAIVEIETEGEPEVSREGAIAIVRLRSSATVSVGAGVKVDCVEVGGNLELSEIAAPFSVARVRGTMRSARTGSIDAATVGGNLEISGASAVRAQSVGGNCECTDVVGDATIEKIGGSVRMTRVGGAISIRMAGGNAEFDDVASLDAGAIGARARVQNASGAVAFGRIGGRLVASDIRAKIGAAYVGGSARLARIGRDVELFDVGGAVDVAGPFAAGASWTVRSRGRISLMCEAADAFDIDAASRWGRVRVHGIEATQLEWFGRSRARGRIGTAERDSQVAKLDIASSFSDVVIANRSEETRDEYCSREWRARPRWSHRFGRTQPPFGEEIPEFVRTVFDSVGKYLMATCAHPGAYVRRAAWDAAAGVREAMAEVERTMSQLGKKIPDDLSAHLSHLGSEIADMVKQAAAHGGEFTRAERFELRHKIRAAAREMRDAIRDAARAARTATASSAQAKPQPAPNADSGATRPFNRNEAILEILRAVKEGRVTVEEADELIASWTQAPPSSAN